MFFELTVQLQNTGHHAAQLLRTKAEWRVCNERDAQLVAHGLGLHLLRALADQRELHLRSPCCPIRHHELEGLKATAPSCSDALTPCRTVWLS